MDPCRTPQVKSADLEYQAEEVRKTYAIRTCAYKREEMFVFWKVLRTY